MSVLSGRLQRQENFIFFFEQSFRYIIIRKLFPVQAHAPASGFPVLRIFDPDMEMFSPEIFVNFKGIPARWDRRRDPDTFQIRPESEDSFHSQCTWERPKWLLAGPSAN